jgi:hypothetical protein
MALGDNYHTLAELKTRLGISDNTDNDALNAASASASRNIEKYCRRQFNDAGSASARVYYPLTSRKVLVDDFWTTTGQVLETDTDDDGAYETVWAATDYINMPLNGVRDGVSGWPYWEIKAVESEYFYNGHRPSVQLTARWGWQSVPAPVKEASLALAEEIFKMKDSPYGIAGFGEFGFVRVRENPKIISLLMSYRRRAVRVAS